MIIAWTKVHATMIMLMCRSRLQKGAISFSYEGAKASSSRLI